MSWQRSGIDFGPRCSCIRRRGDATSYIACTLLVGYLSSINRERTLTQKVLTNSDIIHVSWVDCISIHAAAIWLKARSHYTAVLSVFMPGSGQFRQCERTLSKLCQSLSTYCMQNCFSDWGVNRPTLKLLNVPLPTFLFSSQNHTSVAEVDCANSVLNSVSAQTSICSTAWHPLTCSSCSNHRRLSWARGTRVDHGSLFPGPDPTRPVV